MGVKSFHLDIMVEEENLQLHIFRTLLVM